MSLKGKSFIIVLPPVILVSQLAGPSIYIPPLF